mmetsp:Transcript_12929/g.30740  ORF Transcript_12929/g.30740 Transcript_12929/m.30740 type:complete len:211 (-) Transcript_12929:79-711(-)
MLQPLVLPGIIFGPLLLFLDLVQDLLLLVQLGALVTRARLLLLHKVFELLRLRLAIGLVDDVQELLFQLKGLCLLQLLLSHWLHLLLARLVQHLSLGQLFESILHLLPLLGFRFPLLALLSSLALFLLDASFPLFSRLLVCSRTLQKAAPGFFGLLGFLGKNRADRSQLFLNLCVVRLHLEHGLEIVAGFLGSSKNAPRHATAKVGLSLQ